MESIKMGILIPPEAAVHDRRQRVDEVTGSVRDRLQRVLLRRVRTGKAPRSWALGVVISIPGRRSPALDDMRRSGRAEPLLDLPWRRLG